MRHRPARPAPRSRLRQLFPQRWALLPALVAAAVIGVLAVAVPLMSGAVGAGRVAVDSSSAPGYSPVVMGEDGVPDSSTTATGSRGGGRPSPGDGTPSAGSPSTGATHGDTPTATSAGSPGSAGSAAGRTPVVGASGSATSPSGTSPSATSPSATSPSATSPDGTPSSLPESAAPDSPSSSSAADDPSAQASPASVTDAVLGPIDRARAEQGCAPLRVDDGLTGAALANSLLMAAQGTVAVLTSAGSAVAVATAPDAAAVVDGWLGDSSAGARLLDCSLTAAGVAEATGPGGPWWTLFLD